MLAAAEEAAAAQDFGQEDLDSEIDARGDDIFSTPGDGISIDETEDELTISQEQIDAAKQQEQPDDYDP